ncbi:hypothetical protein BDZ97DRAFT_1904235 [Flammula alnicola]|nr:hypothetical protein BDZ97DRAFT_1904235 [Flammula alnicola]
MFTMDMCESLTWHVFEKPPTKVLEIGCGTGTWILHCARTWKVSLDIVPLHPDLQNVGSPDLASRITWVQYNFLDGLPFQNEEFDFVHIKRIALGVPEDKWDYLFEEIARVMKPGGAFEMVEEDLFFPGKRSEDDDEGDLMSSSVTDDDASSTTRRNSMSSDRRPKSFSINGHDEFDRERERLADVPESDKDEPQTPMMATHNAPFGGANGHGLAVGKYDRPEEDEKHAAFLRPTGAQQLLQMPLNQQMHILSSAPSSSSSHSGLIAPHSRSTARPTLHVKTQRSADPYAELMYGSSTVSLAGSMGYMAYHDPLTDMLKKQQQQQIQQQRGLRPAVAAAVAAGPQKTKVSPFLLRSLTNKSPVNPRDHTILEAVWNGMLESRFVNLTPLSLLTTYLEYHFKDVRTHPPLVYAFPPLPIKLEEDEDEPPTPNKRAQAPGPSDSSEVDTDDARDAVVPRPKKARSTNSRKSQNSSSTPPAPFAYENGELMEDHRWMSMQALMQHQSPYVTLDDSRGYAFSPSKRATFLTRTDKEGKPKQPSVLPNTTLHIDLRSLNLHLALRAKEIIACSESMWEWVLDYQAGTLPNAARGRSGSVESPAFLPGVDESASSSDLDLTRGVIMDMTREDFDHLLNNFEMDMQDKASVGHALQERFDWHVFTSPVLQDRKAFDVACEKYDQWTEEQKQKAPLDPYRQSNGHRSRNSVSTPGLVLPATDSSVSHDHNLIARSTSSPQPSTLVPSERTVDDSSSFATTLALSSLNRHQMDTSSNVHAGGLSSPSTMSHTSIQTMPPQMLSRAMRVFVAWKAS